ncbi:L,D-transpeptidase family protein [Streptomyces sp. H27-C3]|uniref:L,D-transpeptidase family protein n=1 Tax=Streptomyces sp. H27-C3 TaxID=3046305 RepID=UPI0024B894EF|nr:L,D-transpeptidase family protein [Streptomyces sp. H27-C3]MDJ0461946.1 L,D-transpeptidase family protein [Streptomyces sp. H27-C3]
MTAVRRRTHPRALGALLLATGIALTACQSGGAPAATRQSPPPDANKLGTTAVGRPAPRPITELPGLGPRTRGQVPDGTRQALVVTGEGRDKNTGSAVLYDRDAEGGPWRPGPSWPVHNALRGWTDEHRRGDLRSPIGVYGLTDAGGLLPDPGTKLTYDEGPAFAADGTGALGEPLAGSFDYVIAINYNREPGTTPLNLTRPLGEDRGGGIWLHVDHEGPTQGCVSLTEAAMKALLRTVDPAKKPVVVMGDGASLAR